MLIFFWSCFQFTAENQGDSLSLNHGNMSCGNSDKNQFPSNSQGSMGLIDPSEQQQQHHLNNQNQNYGGDGRHNVPNIILTGERADGLNPC